MEYLDIIISLLTLILLEIILGVDNLVFLSILTERLPLKERKLARRWGLSFAWITRLLLLASAVWLTKLTKPIVSFHSFSFSARDLFLFIGGGFLLVKATQEIHFEVAAGEQELRQEARAAIGFKAVVLQVALMDVIFSLDSVLTAVGLSNNFWVMAVAISCAILVMIFASETVSNFIEKYPTLKILALSFLMLIGTVLIADSFKFHIPRGYIYFSMAFSLMVESLNLVKASKIKKLRNKA